MAAHLPPFSCPSFSTHKSSSRSHCATGVLLPAKSWNNSYNACARTSSRPRLPEKSGRISRPPVPDKSPNLKRKISPHRAVAAVRLLRIQQGGAFADLLNEKTKKSGEREMDYVERTLGFRTRYLDDRDMRLVTDIVGGAVRWRRYLDHIIMSLCYEEQTFREMEPLLLQILRIGVYEVIKLGMPSYAVIHENVELAKVSLRPGAGNMVNGILRNLVLLKENDSLPVPKIEGDGRAQARALAILYSHPVWMVRRWTKYLGQEAAMKLMDWNNALPYFTLRANAGKGITRTDLLSRLEKLKVSAELSTNMVEFVRIRTGMQTVIQAGLLKDGLCSVQDESAGLVVYVVDPQPGDVIIDCCAAPGGKTLFMASRLKGKGVVSAIDINKGRLRILKEAAKAQNVDDVITTVHADLRFYAERENVKADKVLLDAPCSGLGVLAKRPDLRWNRRLEDLEHLKNLQDELLHAASKLVKPGGVLVYSTCSIDPEENEERITSFLRKQPEFVIDRVDKYVPAKFVTEKGFYLSDPVRHGIDGSYAARLVRSLEHLEGNHMQEKDKK